MSSSTICKNFVQNAWKKELCSNCFKSKDDHDRQKLQKQLLLEQAKTASKTNATKSIIKTTTKDFKKRNHEKRRVNFSSDICKVIGFGGDDWFESSEDEDNDVEVEEEEETNDGHEDEQEKKLEELTKNNTDLNVNVANKKLQLGKPLVDSSGRKQTLQVQVTPFGQQKPNKKVEPAPVVKQFLVKTAATNKKEEKSLLDEIDETLLEKKCPKQSSTKPDTVKVAKPCEVKQTEKPINEELSEESEDSLKAPYENLITSRELAGEPDGSSACDDTDKEPSNETNETNKSVEIVNLTISPEKPKIPTKPSTILIRKPYVMNTVNKVILSTFHVDKTNPKTSLTRRDSTGSDNGKKRKAPKPPNEESTNIYTRKTPPNYTSSNSDCPVVREKEKRERASSNIGPKIRDLIPEPAPRHSLSLSTDSLNEYGDKKKRNRFSLKKFLRMGGSNNLRDSCESIAPMPKPRLVIVHPTDLQLQQNECKQRPPPPPRTPNPAGSTPNPLPPKSSEVKELQTNLTNVKQNEQQIHKDCLYANIGEVRMAIAPNKPQRTASMREREANMTPKRISYDTTDHQQTNGKIDPNNHLYEYVNNNNNNGNNSNRSSSPEYDSFDGGGGQGRIKYNANNAMPRSASLTYCGSETESEIYAPYSCCYYGSESEQVTEDDWGQSEGRIYNKLRSKKGRSIVHKNLEDNYGAVVIANHEALAQVLDNIQQTNSSNHSHISRAVKSVENLRWNNFVLKNTASCLIGSCAFHEAYWSSQAVVLMISTNPSLPTSPSLSLGTFQLQPVTEFSDLVPVEYTAHAQCSGDSAKIQATVAVLSHVQVDSIPSAAESLKIKNEPHSKDSTFLLLQLVNALKTLQAQGIEDLPSNLNSFVMTKDVDKPDFYRKLHILQGLGEESSNNKTNVTLCTIVCTVLDKLPMDLALSQLIRDILQSERAVSLSQVKSILEFSLWGPSDVLLGNTSQEREVALQRWLDLQRATVLHGLVCTKVQLTVYEECHLLFLVRSNAKIMREASLILDSIKKS